MGIRGPVDWVDGPSNVAGTAGSKLAHCIVILLACWKGGRVHTLLCVGEMAALCTADRKVSLVLNL